jgi:magnesium-transporting ATPase (P-type)
VRKLTAVESLGSCTVIASDKTGTLTVNQQTARRIALPDGQIFTISGEGYNGEGEVSAEDGAELSPALRGIEAEKSGRIGDSGQRGIAWSKKTGLEASWRCHGCGLSGHGVQAGPESGEVKQQINVTKEIPYESELKFSAAFMKRKADMWLPRGPWKRSWIFALGWFGTANQRTSTGKASSGRLRPWRKKACACWPLPAVKPKAPPEAEKGMEDKALSGLVFHGLVGFIDPLRPEAVESVKTCKAAGIQVMMITGDHPATAGAIAKELGLSDRMSRW